MTAGTPEDGAVPVAPEIAAAYLQRVPKVELHVHLEGAVRPERLVAIFQRHGLHRELRHPDDLAWLFRHASFAEFLDHFRFVVTSLRDVQDVYDIAHDLFTSLRAQNVLYAEVLFSAGIFVRQGMAWNALFDAVSGAEADVLGTVRRGNALPRYNMVIDLVRNFGPEDAVKQVDAIVGARHPCVVGVHLGGDEAGFPARGFQEAFARARQAGLGLAAHAGEAVGAASVRDAVLLLGVTRIGHGIRCLEDAELVRALVRGGITLEVCPTSNVCTGVVPELRRHPLPELLRQGLQVTLGADDPSFFDTDLTREHLVAHTVLGLDLDTLDALADTGVRAAFLPEGVRASASAWLQRDRAALRRALRFPGSGS